MSSLARKLRRRTAQRSKPVPFGTSEMLTREPGRIILGIRYGKATLNWQSTLDDIKRFFNEVSTQATNIGRELFGGATDQQVIKRELVQVIIMGMERNDHCDRQRAQQIAKVAMWYMWLKRDEAKFDWERISRLVMHIERRADREYQFSWLINFKEEVELPELERINVWTPYR